MLTIPNASDVRDAAKRIEGWAFKTPLIRNDHLDERTGLKIFLKLENLQRTGTFKFRGAMNRLIQLNETQRRAGVVAFSSGNHAQGVACAARLLGIHATIVMPADAPAIKIQNTRSLGAEIVLYNRLTESREEIGAAIAKQRNCVLVPSYDDFDIIAGQGTVGLEMMQQMDAEGVKPDGVFICCGGGGLTAGCALAIHETHPSTDVFTVEPEHFDDTARSLAAGHRVTNPHGGASFCDALLASTPGELTFAINREHVKAGLVVSEDEVSEAISFAFKNLKVVLEPGGAVTLAAALAKKLPPSMRAVGLVCSGGNVDKSIFNACLQG